MHLPATLEKSSASMEPKKCPTGAKYFDHEGYLYHQHELEDVYGVRRAETKIF